MIYLFGLHWGMHPNVWRTCRTARALGLEPQGLRDFEAFMHRRVR